jgi:serine/threonine-protein kinase
VTGWLGSGGMGDVFEVVHTALGRRFALKALRPEHSRDADMVGRFQREVHAMASVVSEHVVSIVDSGTMPDGAPFFVMERLAGQDLRRLLAAQGPLAPARASQLGVDACRGLAAVHKAGLVHRDLKPENLFVSIGDDGREVCKILDFGVAKSARDNSTRPGALVGTTRYMAPEQVGLELTLGAHTDIYALGVILYECLSGKLPFDGDTVERVLFKIMNEQEKALRDSCPHISAGLAAAVHAALRKKPEQRPASALAFAEALLPHAAPHKPRVVIGGLLDIAQPSIERPDAENATPRMWSAEGATNTTGGRSVEVPKTGGHGRPLIAAVVLSGCAASALTWLATRATPAEREQAPSPATHAVATALPRAADASSASALVSVSPQPIAPAASLGGSQPSATTVKLSASSRAPIASGRSAAAGQDARASRSADAEPPAPAFDPKNPYAP